MNSLANLLKPFLLGFVLNFLKSKGPNQTFSSRIFRVLHTVQSLIFKVLRYSLSQTARIFYHKLFCLSRTFLKNFFVSLLWSLSSNFYMLPHFFRSVNNFFQVFYFAELYSLQRVLIISQSSLFVNNFLWLIFIFLPEGQKNNHLEKWAEKEGFEPSRRFPDLHP